MKLDRQYLQNKAYDFVMERLHAEGFVAYGVGGCVRDAVMGSMPNDVDVATNARPHDLPKVFGTKPWDGDTEKRYAGNGVVLYPTGVRHGTWTVRYADEDVEVTTFRRDVDTDGRNATVEYADTVEEDALRRDFTMNAMYVDQADNVLDPTGTGLADILAGKVRFVGSAEERVKEAYLRILRLFRSLARFGRGPMDVDAWNAASKWKFMLKKAVSGERIWDEVKKLLSLHSPFEAVCEMHATGVLDELFSTRSLGMFGALMAHERRQNCAPRWTRRYVTLVGNEVPYPHSNSEQSMLDDLNAALNVGTMSQAVCAHKYGDVVAYDFAVCRGARVNHKQITRGLEAVMPVSSQDLMLTGFKPGKALGDALRGLEKLWIETDMELGREDLLNHLRRDPNLKVLT